MRFDHCFSVLSFFVDHAVGGHSGRARRAREGVRVRRGWAGVRVSLRCADHAARERRSPCGDVLLLDVRRGVSNGIYLGE